MLVAKRIKGKAIAALLGPMGQKARHALARARGDGPLAYYFDVEDPWSYLGAQVLARLVAHYQVPFELHVISRPAQDVVPAGGLRDAYAVRDAHELASYYDLDFPGKKTADPGMALRMACGLVRELSAEERLAAILEMGKGLWTGDNKPIATVLGRIGAESTVAVPPILATSYSALRKRGHYLGAMFWHRGTWYGALDRLGHLEAALAKETGKAVAGVVRVRPEGERGPLRLATDKNRPTLAVEAWFSFRSPYSYLALEQLAAAIEPSGLPLVLRPIAPMVERGQVLVSAKRNYILEDAKREADRLGLPFGEVCDPLGKGVEACLAISHHLAARDDGHRSLLAFARSALRGAWSQARDLSEYVDLRAVVEQADLSFADAARWVAESQQAGAAMAAANAADLEAMGLWGVPSFRVGDLWLWGQDRLELLTDRLRRHALAVAAQPAAEAPTPTTPTTPATPATPTT